MTGEEQRCSLLGYGSRALSSHPASHASERAYLHVVRPYVRAPPRVATTARAGDTADCTENMPQNAITQKNKSWTAFMQQNAPHRLCLLPTHLQPLLPVSDLSVYVLP